MTDQNTELDQLIGELTKLTDSNFKMPTDIKNKNLLLTILVNRCQDPVIRSLVRPCGELYAPVYYDSDCLVKLTWKPSYQYFVLFFTNYKLAIFDIDNQEYTFDDIEKVINESEYRDELFFVHKTERGYHLYQLSTPIDYCSLEVLKYCQQIKIVDPAHARNSLYTGYSVRCSKKKGDSFVSKLIGKVGNGKVNYGLLNIYLKCQTFIRMFEKCDPDSILTDENLFRQFEYSMVNNGRHGNVHITEVAPLLIIGYNENKVVISRQDQINDEDIQLYKKMCKYGYYNYCQLDKMLVIFNKKIKSMIQYNILESNDDYAYGIDLGHSLYFISYRNLLMIDYDNKNRIQILYAFIRYHPEYLFRIVETNKGYHCFLLSHPMYHKDKKSIELLYRLRSDPLHILGAYSRGYSVRLNPKYEQKNKYKELRSCGKGQIDPHLEKLYKLHLDLTDKLEKSFVCQNVQMKLMNIK